MSKPWPAWPITKADGTGITHVPFDSNHDVESPLPGPLDHIVDFLQTADAIQERYPTPCLAHSRIPLPLSGSRIGVFSSGTGDSGPDELVHESLSFYSDGRRRGSGERRRNWLGPGPAPLALNVDNVERSFRQAHARGYSLHPFPELTPRCAITMTPVCLTLGVLPDGSWVYQYVNNSINAGICMLPPPGSTQKGTIALVW